MGSAIQYLIKHKLINCPNFIYTNLIYETTFGSRAYGVSDESSSDYDLTAVVLPPKAYLFPNTAGYIVGFDNDYPKFEQYQDHHIEDKSSGKNFDVTIYGIVKYFRLLYDNNPNILDSLFVPDHCIRHTTKIGNLLRDNRQKFLSKECWQKYRGYAATQWHKIQTKSPTGKRKEIVDKWGFDLKFAYNVMRLMDLAYMILTEGNLDLTCRNAEWKAIRKGEWTFDRLEKEFEQRKLICEEAYKKTTLQEKPDIKFARDLLMECLEIQYGNIEEVYRPDSLKIALQNIDNELNKVKTQIYT